MTKCRDKECPCQTSVLGETVEVERLQPTGARFNVAFTLEEALRLCRSAEEEGIFVTEFIRRAALEACSEVDLD